MGNSNRPKPKVEVSNWVFLKILHLATSAVIEETNQTIRIYSVFGRGRLLLSEISVYKNMSRLNIIDVTLVRRK
jgi:hypothetical protein